MVPSSFFFFFWSMRCSLRSSFSSQIQLVGVTPFLFFSDKVWGKCRPSFGSKSCITSKIRCMWWPASRVNMLILLLLISLVLVMSYLLMKQVLLFCRQALAGTPGSMSGNLQQYPNRTSQIPHSAQVSICILFITCLFVVLSP